jgi:hypothetical protein
VAVGLGSGSGHDELVENQQGCLNVLKVPMTDTLRMCGTVSLTGAKRKKVVLGTRGTVNRNAI